MPPILSHHFYRSKVIFGIAAAQATAWLARHELALLVVATPLLLFPGPWSLAGLALIMLGWLARALATGRLTARTGLEPPIALLAVTSLLGCAVAPDRSHSQAALWSLLLGVAWFYGLANGQLQRAALRRLSWLWLIAAASLLALAVAGIDWQTSRLLPLPIYDLLPEARWRAALGSLGNPRVAGMALGMAIPLMLALAAWGRGAGLRLVSLLMALAMTAVLVLTQSLQGALGLALGVVVLLVIWSRWTLLALLVAAGLAIGAASSLDWRPLALTALDIGHPAGAGVVLRLDIWSRALAMVADMPLTGTGLDSYVILQAQFYPGHLLGPEPHAHSLALQLALEMGMAGLLGFVWLLAAFASTAARALRRAPQPEERALLAGAAAGVASMVGAGLIDTIWVARPAVLFWLLLGTGVVAAPAVAQRNTATGPIFWAQRWHVAAGALIAVVWLTLALSPGVWQTNWGLLQAHRALLAARSSGSVDASALQQARSLLLVAQDKKPGDPQVHDTLAGLDAWLGEEEAALAALSQRLNMDGADPMGRYAPWEQWRRRLLNESPPSTADDLAKVYSHWMVRYPDRAEGYVRVALVWERLKGDPARAAAVLQDGLQRGAQPAGLLNAALARLNR